jgi:hypothetical protein
MPSDKDMLAQMMTTLIESDLKLLESGEASPQDKERMRKLLHDHGIQAGQKNSPILKLAENLPFQETQKTA